MPKSQFTPAYASFVRILVAARKEAGLTQVELADRLGKPQPFISSIEQGVRRVDLIEFYAIARALRADPEQLFKRVLRSLPRTVEI